MLFIQRNITADTDTRCAVKLLNLVSLCEVGLVHEVLSAAFVTCLHAGDLIKTQKGRRHFSLAEPGSSQFLIRNLTTIATKVTD